MAKKITLEVPNKIWNQLEVRAAENEISAEDFALGLLAMGASMDAAIWPSLTHISLKANVPEALVLQNSVIYYLAQKVAWEEQFPEEKWPIPEFVRTSDGIKTGLAYLDQLIGFFKGQNSFAKRFMEEFTIKGYESLLKWNQKTPPEEAQSQVKDLTKKPDKEN